MMVIFMDIIAKIKKAEVDGLLVIGAKSVASRIRLGGLDSVIVSSNCPGSLKDDISHSSKLSEIPVAVFEGDSSDLGEQCKKPFTIAVLGILKKDA